MVYALNAGRLIHSFTHTVLFLSFRIHFRFFFINAATIIAPQAATTASSIFQYKPMRATCCLAVYMCNVARNVLHATMLPASTAVVYMIAFIYEEAKY